MVSSSPERLLRAPIESEMARARRVVGDVLEPTPLLAVEIDGRRLWLKLESFQPTGSFKVRGALAAIDHVAASRPSTPVVACSAGNHGLGVAFASSRLGVQATVVVPTSASSAKVERLRTFPIELILHGATYGEAEEHALELSTARHAAFLSPYNDAHVIAGQSTMASEILDQHGTGGHLVVSVGGGGLLSGSLLALHGHPWKVHGALVAQNAAFATELGGGIVDESLLRPTVADGLAGAIEPGSVTVEIARDLDAHLILVTEEDTRRSVRRGLFDAGVLMEGSAGVALAAACKLGRHTDDEIVVAISGRNIAPHLLAEILADPAEGSGTSRSGVS